MPKIIPRTMKAVKQGNPYSQAYMIHVPKEMEEEMMAHQQHHYPESPLDSKTVPYSVSDDKHKGRR